MRSEITENKEFYIISRSIDNADRCKVIKVCEDCFKVKLKNPHKYEIDESVELFAMTSLGQLYFETIVKNVENDIISIWFPISAKHLQRREYSRICENKEITLNDGIKQINAFISDISAGGLKVESKEPPELLKEYDIVLNVENKIIKTKFQPIRIEALTNTFVSSGRFNELDNYDRISLVQYCFRKQIENSTL